MTTLPNNIPFKISSSDPITQIDRSEQIVIGQLGQTLDGCIATTTGESKYINSENGLRHLHRIRSAVDAVVIGVGSVNTDNPKLTVRHCSGHDPVKVIIDPNGRVDTDCELFSHPQKPVIFCRKGLNHPAAELAEVITLPYSDGQIDTDAIIYELKLRGLKKILVEGGNFTLSKFLEAGSLDRLHLIVAPIIMGSGRQSLDLFSIEKLNQALRPKVTLYPLGKDILYDCKFDRNVLEYQPIAAE